MPKRKPQNAPRKSLRTRKPDDKRGTNPRSLANLELGKFKPGVSGNPGGRPKLLGESYREWLAQVNENDAEGRTNAQLGAVAVGVEMLKGDISAAREIRSATEGEKVTLATWEMEIIDLLKQGKLTAQEVIDGLDIDDARKLLIAAGTPFPESASHGKDGE